MAHLRSTFNFNPGYHFFFPLQQIVDFPGESVVRNPPANAGDMGSSLLWEDFICRGATKPMLRNKRSHHNKKPLHGN